MIGHGQMPEAELEEVMEAFADGEADVLVCTTIIESGLDMPNVNTLILDRSDRFGLSQLYQLRGRVGRGESTGPMLICSCREASALPRPLNSGCRPSWKRRNWAPGSGLPCGTWRFAALGILLGAAQSGQIHAVGLELYGQLLDEAVSELMAGESADGQQEAGVGTYAIAQDRTSGGGQHSRKLYPTHSHAAGPLPAAGPGKGERRRGRGSGRKCVTASARRRQQWKTC